MGLIFPCRCWPFATPSAERAESPAVAPRQRAELPTGWNKGIVCISTLLVPASLALWLGVLRPASPLNETLYCIDIASSAMTMILIPLQAVQILTILSFHAEFTPGSSVLTRPKRSRAAVDLNSDFRLAIFYPPGHPISTCEASRSTRVDPPGPHFTRKHTSRPRHAPFLRSSRPSRQTRPRVVYYGLEGRPLLHRCCKNDGL